MKCIKCGSQIPDNGKFCLECGEKIVENPKMQKVLMKCSVCNGEMEMEEDSQNLICPYCGSKELIIDSDAVAVEKIKSKTYKEIEFAKIKNESDRELRREEREMRENYKKSKFAKVTMIFFFIALIATIVGFSTGHVFMAIITLLQCGAFAVSWMMGMQIIKEKFKYLHMLVAFAGFALVVLYMFGPSKSSSKKYEEMIWPSKGLATYVPKPETEYGLISINDEKRFFARIEKMDEDAFKEYKEQCKAFGYIVEAEEDNDSYSAYNSEGVKIDLKLWDKSESVDIEVEESKSKSKYTWPGSELAKRISKPKSEYGTVESDSSQNFVIYIAKTSKDEFWKYVEECEQRGFVADYNKGDNSYYAYDNEGYYINLKYQGNETFRLEVKSPDKLVEEQKVAEELKAMADGTYDKSDEEEPLSENEETDDVLDAEEVIDSEETETEEAKEEVGNEEKKLINGVDADLVAFLDEYEAFMDEYVAFMKKYNSSNDATGMLGDYLKILDRYSDFAKKADGYNNENMSASDLKYYTERMLKIEKKLLSAY